VHRPEALAQAADIQYLQQLMREVHQLETDLLNLGNVVNAATIEMKASIKKKMTSPKTTEVRFIQQ
jgi:hypothetical protein